MAAPLDPAGTTPSLVRLATFLYRFPLPASKLLAFDDCFARSMGDQECAQTISHMDKVRKDLVHELATGTPNYLNVVASAERYVPLIAQTLHSLEQARDPVYLDKPLVFSWATGIGLHPRTNWITNQAVVWDKCMALAAQAIAHADSVCDLVEPSEAGGSSGDRYAEAGMRLRTAAGAFQRLHREELPRWIGETAKSVRPPEATEGICEGLVYFLLAEAQQMAVGKALAGSAGAGKAPPPPTLLAKLCLGVAAQLESCVGTMRSKGGMGYSNLDPTFLVHVTLVSEVYRAMAYRFLAIHAWSQDRFGTGVALMREAVKHLSERRDITSVGVPKLEAGGPLTSLAPALQTLRREFQQLQSNYLADNNKVYYDPVPATADLDPLPAPTIMMQPLPYPVPPAPKALVFKATVKQEAAEASTGGAQVGPASAAAAAPAAPAVTMSAPMPTAGEDKTDEQMAKELHDALNVR